MLEIGVGFNYALSENHVLCHAVSCCSFIIVGCIFLKVQLQVLMLLDIHFHFLHIVVGQAWIITVIRMGCFILDYQLRFISLQLFYSNLVLWENWLLLIIDSFTLLKSEFLIGWTQLPKVIHYFVYINSILIFLLFQ